MKVSVRKVICLILVLAVSLGFLFVAWGIYVHYLTRLEDKACLLKSAARDSSANDQELQQVLENYSAKHDEVGLQATVIYPDGTQWSGVIGYASQEKQCHLTHDHHLYIGSMTKLFTAVLVMKQVEAGTISLDDTVDNWLDLPYANRITVRMLLNHTSGIPSYTEDAWFLLRYFAFPRKRWQPQELMAAIPGKELKFAPGSQHEYSNSNYLLLGMILEKATDKSFEDLLHELAVDQLELADTHYLNQPADFAVANGYDETLLNLGRRNLTGFRTSLESGAFAAGGIVSNSGDVARFTQALFSGQIVGDAALVQMKEMVAAPDEDMPSQQGYGLGIRNLVLGEENLIGHTGTIPGYSGIAMHSTEKQYTIVILSNLSIIEQEQLLTDVQAVVLHNISQ